MPRPRRPIGRRQGPRGHPRGPAPRGPTGGPGQPALRALRRAHRQLETGHYAQAYPALKRLADGAAQRGMPVQAATLYAQAARSRIEMAGPGSVNAAWDAVALGQRALHLLANAGRAARAQSLLARMLQLLEDKGYHQQAVTLRAEGSALLGSSGAGPTPEDAGSVAQTALPTNCPSCNAPLRSDEVEWIDGQSAECAYCGSVVRAE